MRGPRGARGAGLNHPAAVLGRGPQGSWRSAVEVAAVNIGQASCSVRFTPPPQLPLGTQQVAASYSGDSEFSPSGAQIATVTPSPAALLAAVYEAVTTPSPAGPGNSLGSKVQQAQAYYAAGDVADFLHNTRRVRQRGRSPDRQEDPGHNGRPADRRRTANSGRPGLLGTSRCQCAPHTGQ
jgi:hypothetical protein